MPNWQLNGRLCDIQDILNFKLDSEILYFSFYFRTYFLGSSHCLACASKNDCILLQAILYAVSSAPLPDADADWLSELYESFAPAPQAAPQAANQLENYAYQSGYHGVPYKTCVLDGTYLAWHNGEPIEEEVRQTEAGDPSWCAAKCDANSKCDAWTLNKRNGWCALKRGDQVKGQKNEGFVSGTKTC